MSAKQTNKASKELETFLFPTLGVSVEAKNLEEALAQVETDKREVGDDNS